MADERAALPTPQPGLRPDATAIAVPGLLAGRRGLIMGVANDHSIAWGIARAAAAAGAELAFTYQTASFARRVAPLAAQAGSDLLVECDVAQPAEVERAFGEIGRRWTSLDFVVHAIAWSDKEELKGRYVDTSLDNFLKTMAVSCFSFTTVARCASEMMGRKAANGAGTAQGGSLITLSYHGSTQVMPNYNVMGVAKAALEASVRYLATDLGPDGIRVNAISAGPMRTLAGSAVGSARQVYNYSREVAPLRRNVVLDDVGGAAMYLLSDLSAAVTGTVHYVDGGFHTVGMPTPRAENGS